MSERGSLAGLTVTMRKHPDSFKLNGDLHTKNESVKGMKQEGEAYHTSIGPALQTSAKESGRDSFGIWVRGCGVWAWF